MAQQMVNGSEYKGSQTFTNRMTYRYAVVNPPFSGKHLKPQTPAALEKRLMVNSINAAPTIIPAEEEGET